MSVVVIGSLNMDLVVRIPRMPELGETIRGSDLQTFPGGKGANQAAAISLLGNDVIFIGRVGHDEFGLKLINNLKNLEINTEHIYIDNTCVTGTAMIMVEEEGSNCIVISPGANNRLSINDIRNIDQIIREAEIIVLQLEIPINVVEFVISTASNYQIPIVLNPSPFIDLSMDLLGKIDYLVLNEIEAKEISTIQVFDIDSSRKAAQNIINIGVSNVVITLGSKGSVFLNDKDFFFVPPIKVKVIDTTAAGDAFVGGFVTGIINGLTHLDAVRYGNCAGAVSVTRKGAQPSLPTLDEIKGYYQSHY